MTSPSPVDSIAKAMEGAEITQRECVFAAQEARKANGADTYPARVLDKAAGVIADLARQAEAMKRENAELREALKPFATIAERDIGHDENDADLFQPMSKHNRAPRLTVGDFRRAAAIRNMGGGENE